MAVLKRVNGDDTKEAAQNSAATARITWRSFRNGGPDGPISQSWNVHRWPTLYLIDHRGTIVGKIGTSDETARCTCSRCRSEAEMTIGNPRLGRSAGSA
jgi:hypothetical protein